MCVRNDGEDMEEEGGECKTLCSGLLCPLSLKTRESESLSTPEDPCLLVVGLLVLTAS